RCATSEDLSPEIPTWSASGQSPTRRFYALVDYFRVSDQPFTTLWGDQDARLDNPEVEFLTSKRSFLGELPVHEDGELARGFGGAGDQEPLAVAGVKGVLPRRAAVWHTKRSGAGTGLKQAG